MEANIEKECSALGGLFQAVINDMKVSIFQGNVVIEQVCAHGSGIIQGAPVP